MTKFNVYIYKRYENGLNRIVDNYFFNKSAKQVINILKKFLNDEMVTHIDIEDSNYGKVESNNIKNCKCIKYM